MDTNFDFDRITAGFLSKMLEVTPRELNHDRMKHLETSGELRSFLSILADEELFSSVLDVRRGTHEIVPIEHIIDLPASPFLPNGWKVEEHKGEGVVRIERSVGELYIDGKKVNLFFADDIIKGTELREIVKDQPVLNANVLDYLLEHQEFIPDSWKGKYIFFWGTIYWDSDGLLSVRYFTWGGDRWDWGTAWLGSDWSSRARAAVLAH